MTYVFIMFLCYTQGSMLRIHPGGQGKPLVFVMSRCVTHHTETEWLDLHSLSYSHGSVDFVWTGYSWDDSSLLQMTLARVGKSEMVFLRTSLVPPRGWHWDGSAS